MTDFCSTLLEMSKLQIGLHFISYFLLTNRTPCLGLMIDYNHFRTFDTQSDIRFHTLNNPKSPQFS